MLDQKFEIPDSFLSQPLLSAIAPALPAKISGCGMTWIESKHSDLTVVEILMMLLEPLRNHLMVLLQHRFITPGTFFLP